MAQGDTKWFADVDYQEQASIVGVELRPTILLLFGGPAPGGKAMMTSPKIGLDAFCQKLLVYENEDGEVWIAYNDIVAFAELYYQTSTKPQQMINQKKRKDSKRHDLSRGITYRDHGNYARYIVDMRAGSNNIYKSFYVLKFLLNITMVKLFIY